MLRIFIAFLLSISLPIFAVAQEHGHDHDDHESTHQTTDSQHDDHGHGDKADHHDDHGHSGGGHANACGYVHEDIFNPGAAAFHHISDHNVYSIGPLQLPLPCIIYVPGEGMKFFSSGKMKPDTHGTGTVAFDKFVLLEGQVHRVTQPGFPEGEIEIGKHNVYYAHEKDESGKEVNNVYVCYDGKQWLCDKKSTLDGGVLGGGLTSFYDFSITKNVVSMLIVFIVLAWIFIGIAGAYKKRDGMAPKGIQSFFEPMILFIQEEVAKPFLGHKWERYQPFLLSIFFFILALNLFGQVPFFGGSNVTGNLSFTLVMAVFAFLVTNLSGNKHYWEHIFWMPGVPAWVKTILTPVELMGVFIKPLTLLLRLFGNMTAGHMVMVIFVGLIFIFGENGANPGVAWGTSIGSAILTLFMMAIELLVAFLQAFVFTILTASYIGAAVEEGHHDHHAEEHH